MSLGPDARSLLDAARGGDEPEIDDAFRVRAKIAAQIAIAGAATAGAKSAAAATTSKTAAGGAIAKTAAAGASIKIAIAFAVVGASSATGAAVLHERSVASRVETAPAAIVMTMTTPAATKPAAPLPAPTMTGDRGSMNEPAERGIALDPTPAPIVPAPRLRPRDERMQNAPIARSAPSGPAAALSPPTVAPPPPDAVALEAGILRSAREALARGDGPGALAKLDEHAARFPSGAMRSEREAARVHALCASGRAGEARAAASAFVASNPRSPLAQGVRRSCATSE